MSVGQDAQSNAVDRRIGRDHRQAALVLVHQGPRDGLLPNSSAHRVDRVARRAVLHDRTFADDRHLSAQRGDVADDVRREQDHDLARQFGEQILEAIALLRIEPGRRLVDHQQFRRADQRLRDAEALAHAARITSESTLLHAGEIHALEQRRDDVLAITGVGDALHAGEVVEHLLGRQTRIDAEVLRQVAEDPPHVVLANAQVEIVQHHRAVVGLEQCRETLHQGRLAGAVRTEQSEHPVLDREADAAQRLDAAGVGLPQVSNFKHVCRAILRKVGLAELGRTGTAYLPRRRPAFDQLPAKGTNRAERDRFAFRRSGRGARTQRFDFALPTRGFFAAGFGVPTSGASG